MADKLTSAGILTTASTVDCGHGGAVSTVGTAKFTVGGKSVLLEDGVKRKQVSTLCATENASSGGMKKCTSVTGVTAGPATKLTVGKVPVLRADDLAGTTDGLVAGVAQTALKGQAGQTKVKAV